MHMTKRNILFLICIMGVQMALYLFLANREVTLTPLGHVHAMMQIDTYYPDIIRQSKMGRWVVIDDHTTLPAPKVRSYVFFILAGKIAALFNIDPVSMYEILRITGAVYVFLATYLFITQFLPPALHTLAILFTLVIETGPTMFLTAASLGQFTIFRHFGLPHHLWGEALGLTLMFLLFKAIKRPSHRLLVSIFILGFMGTATLPSYFVIITASVFMPWLLYGVATKTIKKIGPPVILATLSILAAGLWIKYEFSKGPPWDAMVAVEKSWWTTEFIMVPFVQSLSLFYPFVFTLFLMAFKSWSQWSKQIKLAVILAGGWSIIPFALIYLAALPWFPIVNGRIASDVTPVPFGILSTLGIYAIWQQIKHMPWAKTAGQLLIIVFTAFSLCLSILYYKQALKAQDKAVYNEGYSWTLYPTLELWEGMMALKKVPPFSHVMILPRIGEMITAYVPVRAYQSAPLTFVDWLYRRGQSHLFYTGTLEFNELRELLRLNNISYVFWGPEEKTALKTPSLYPDILEVFFQNSEVTIFKIKKL